MPSIGEFAMTLATEFVWIALMLATALTAPSAAAAEKPMAPAAKETGPRGTPPKNKVGATPTGPLTKEQGEALLRADWLIQADNDPSAARAREEIEAASAIAARLAAHPKQPSFAPELAELARLAAKVDAIAAKDQDQQQRRDLYFAIRAVKRRIVFGNPAVDFERVLLIDGAPPSGHQTRTREAPGRQKGQNRIVAIDSLRPDAGARDVIPNQVGRVMRMDLDFDASKLVYSLYSPPTEPSYHLYEVPLSAEGVAAGPARQLTNSVYNDMDPIYLPDGKIAFCTTRGNTFVRCLPDSPCMVLARCDPDGRNIRFTSLNSEPDYTPCLLPDGRVLYTRWEYTDRPFGRLEKLWTANPDGTQVSHFWGNRSCYPDMMWEARPIPGTSKVMFTGVGHHQVEGGPIGIIDVNEGRDFPEGIHKVTMEIPWTEVGDPRNPAQNRPYSPNYRACKQFRRFASPYPLGSADFLVSASVQGQPFGLYLMDVHGNRELIYRGTGQDGVWCALPLRSRPRPPVIPERVVWPRAGEKPLDGMIFSPNVWQGLDSTVADKAKYLRVLQQDAKTYSMGFKSFRTSGPAISAIQDDGVKRIVGTVPIHPDGSVSFTLPPGRAVYFQLLDEDQRCLQTMRSFTGVLPGETRGCLGCHEQNSTVAANATADVMALRKPVQRPTPPPWGTEVSVGYERFVQPVLDKHCGRCHQGDGKARAALDLTLRGGVKKKGLGNRSCCHSRNRI
jgi:hypothetical protein